jgi:hypothetical protein
MKIQNVCVLVSALALGCTGVNWPKVLQCADPVAQAELNAVAAALASNTDVESALAQVAKNYAAGTVECAVQSIVSDLSARKGAARDDHSLERGRAFLSKVTK